MHIYLVIFIFKLYCLLLLPVTGWNKHLHIVGQIEVAIFAGNV